ncbi:hypothetical protein [Streptococcus agalactiae]|nr:hypothetical protein [Streptococcus agalactiae]
METLESKNHYTGLFESQIEETNEFCEKHQFKMRYFPRIGKALSVD